MRLPAPRRVQSDRRDVNDLQDATQHTLRDVVRFEELSGQRIDDLVLTADPQQISHGLGRCPIGWRLVDKRSAGDVYRTAWDGRTLSLRTDSGTVICDLFIW